MKNQKKFICKYCSKVYKTEGPYKKHEENCAKKEEKMDKVIEAFTKKTSPVMSKELEEAVLDELKTQDETVKETKEPTKAVIDFLTKDEEVKDIPETIEDKLIKFFEGRDMTSINLNKERLKEFKALHLAYYGRAMLKTCRNGIVQVYKSLYYAVEVIKKQRDEQI